MAVSLLLTGRTDHESAQVVVKADAGATVRVARSLSPSMSTPTFSDAVTSDAQGYAKVNLTGLTAGQRYYIRAEVGGVLDTVVQGSFRTHPAAPGQPIVGKILTSSCVTNKSNHQVFDTMRQTHPDSLLFLHTGDQNYSDIGTSNPDDFRAAQLNGWIYGTRRRAFFRSTAVDWVWDDHDFGPNDSDGTFVGKDANAAVYRQTFPHYDLPDAAGAIYHTFDIGRVRFIVTDQRYYRSFQGTQPVSARTVLGATQLQWFKDQVLAAQADPDVMLTVWVSTQVPFANTAAANWASYVVERQAIWDFFAANDIGRRRDFVIFAGDIHCCALKLDIDYSTGGDANPIPQFIASSLDQKASTTGGAEWDAYYGERGGYGCFQWIDQGTHLECVYDSRACIAGVDTVVWSHSWNAGLPPGQYRVTADGTRRPMIVHERTTARSLRVPAVVVLDDGIPPPEPPPVGDGEGGDVIPPPVDDSIVLTLAPELWLDAADTSTITLTSGAVSAWADKSGNARTVSQGSSSLRPLSGITTWNGRNVVDFDADWLAAATASHWTFCHNGTPWEAWLVVMPGFTSNPNVRYPLMGNIDLSTERGFRISYEDRSSVSRNDGLSISVTNGTSGQQPVAASSPNDVMPAAQIHMLRVRLDPGNAVAADRSVAWINLGEPITTNTTTFTPTTSAPTRALRIGSGSGSEAGLVGSVAEVIIVKRHLDDDEALALATYLDAKWALDLDLPEVGGAS